MIESNLLTKRLTKQWLVCLSINIIHGQNNLWVLDLVPDKVFSYETSVIITF